MTPDQLPPNSIPLPETAQALATETAIYRRELPALLAAGEEGRYVLIVGDREFSVWDTYGDALQMGYKLVGLGPPFFVSKIKADDAAWLGALILPEVSAPCPS
jgi:hypothetical protein